MLQKIETYFCDGEHPKNEDIQEAIDIAKKNDCIVEMCWCHAYSGIYKRLIYKDDSVEDVCENRFPHIYPV